MALAHEIVIRPAARSDVPAIVALLADDTLGASRESPGDLAPYYTAFAAVESDPHQLLVVMERDSEVLGTLQLTFIPGLSLKGAWRCQVEAVRIASSERGAGLGAALIQWAIEEARARGCEVVQLTSDNTRTDAHRFYERLGFHMSHQGFKLPL